MFTKLEQRSWIKIEVTRERSTQGLREKCGDAALPYRTVARRVKAFQEGRDAVQDKLRTGRHHVENNNIVQLLTSLLNADRGWNACELAVSRSVSQSHEISEVQQWHRPCMTGTTTVIDADRRWTACELAVSRCLSEDHEISEVQ